MTLIRRVAGVLVILAIFFAGIALLLPERFKVERSVEIDAPAPTVYALIADPREWRKWAVWNQRDPGMRIDYSGARSGKGAIWSWQSKSEGSGTMEFTEAIEGAGIVYTLVLADFGMQSKGQLAIVPSGQGVRVLWSNEGELGLNPLHRWFGAFMDKMVGPDFEAGLTNLKRIAEGG
jgi:uncharacterized protein YndB with AHSA1/START domain